MDITPPRLPLDSLLKRRPMTVFTVSCPPAEAVARCAQFWRVIGIKRESTTMCKRFADIGWSGTEVTIDGEELLIMKESDILGVIA